MNEEKNSSDLWSKIVNEGVEDRVEVNQRMLIDKMLSRYSSEFVIYRELIQNSDDAQSRCFTLEITCDPTSSTYNYSSINKSNSHPRSTNQILEGIGNLLKTSLGFNTNPFEPIPDHGEHQFNNCLINQIRTINNGNIFNDADWKRVITIAEGNTNVDAIGQFGVGFFSVFSYSEKPMIQSGKYCLAFAWQNGRSLTTFRKELPVTDQTLTTSIILPMKNQFILQTKTNLSSDENRSTKAKKNIQTNEIVPTLDLTQLKAFFTKVLSFTKYLNELIIQINGQIVFQVKKTIKPLENNKLLTAGKLLNENLDHNLLVFQSFKQTEQMFKIENGPSIELFHFDVQAKVQLEKQFQKQIEQVIKKSLPSTIQFQFLFPSNNIFEDQQWKSSSRANVYLQMLKELIPLKSEDDQINPCGQIFIGLATHQSTGIGMHVFTHLIPTIERENVDLQDPYISIWNEQLLTSIGKIVRYLYDQTILHVVNNTQQTSELINILLSPYSFRASAPNEDIGRLIVDGFFSSDRDILVPVKRTPSDKHLSLIPSSEAFLSTSKHIQTFLPVPLVPFEIGKNEFFKTLKRRQWIEEITPQIILKQIQQILFSKDQFIGLLRWLCTTEPNFIKQIFTKIRYQDEILLELENVEYFDTLNVPSLPLPSNVLPSSIVCHLSREDLQRRLTLSPMEFPILIQFYLTHGINYLINEKTSTIILSFISQRFNQLNTKLLNEIKDKLSNIQCIPTNQGMKIPNESFLYSSNSSTNIPIIQLNISQIERIHDEYPVSIDFLKSIGCRTIYISSTDKSSEELSQTNEQFIEDLLKKRTNLSENDFKALKSNQSLFGTTLDCSLDKRKYRPNELHFPSIAQRLQWNNLLILDWSDKLEEHSREYSFLKELGVKQVPDLHQLMQRIHFEYENSSKNKDNYQLAKSFLFFVEYFQSHYSKCWNNYPKELPFLPSSFAQSSDVILTTPNHVFQELNPFFPSLIPDAIRCLTIFIDLSLIGIKPRPNISMAFHYLLERKSQLLTVENVPKYFSYLNKLDGLNKKFIENLSKISFIPLPGTNQHVKPNEVFIRSKSIDDDEDISRGLIDYVDYGDEANSFLKTIGVLSYPAIENLAFLLLDRQMKYFQQGNEQILTSKLRFYTNCLKQMSIGSRLTEQLNREPLKTRLRNEPWCLAYQYLPNSTDRTFKIVRPADVYLDDDHQSAQDIRPLCAPDEPDLIALYQLFGSKWLSEHVQRTLIHQGDVFVTDRSKNLFELINHRLDMLFVNNRGEFIENFDKKRFELLKNEFNVYECDSIQCQIHFQKKTILLNSNECSSCALELNRKKVHLFIRKDLTMIDYIDISSELTRFLTHKTNESIIHSISDKLSSPLQTLKRRGIPVDRLLKTTQQQQPVKFTLPIQQKAKEETLTQQTNVKEKEQFIQHQQEINEQTNELIENGGGFLQSLRDFLVPFQRSSSPQQTNSNERISSEVRSERVENFHSHQANDEQEINEMLRKTRPYVSKEMIQNETYKEENNNSCEYIPSSNLIRYEYLLNGISFFYDQNIQITPLLIQHGKQLSWILSALCKDVFHLSIETIHLFRDIDSARIAFNNNGSLFYNLRYFEQVFANPLKESLEKGLYSSSSSDTLRKIVNFYYMVTCHELCHNIYSNHDLNFINSLQRVSVQFMDEKDRFLGRFSFVLQ